MSTSPETASPGSPKVSPTGPTIKPTRLVPLMTDLTEELEKERRVSKQLAIAYKELQPQVDKMTEEDGKDKNDWEDETTLKQPTITASIELAMLGIELATKKKRLISIEREIVDQKRTSGKIKEKEAKARLIDLNKRYISAGDELWRHHKKKARLEDPGMTRCIEPNGRGVSESILSIYRQKDNCSIGETKSKKQRENWRRDSEAYYEGSSSHHDKDDDTTWCHATGRWFPREGIKAAHIVPFFFDIECTSELLFGKKAVSLGKPENSLLMSARIQRWFDKYLFVIVPVDARETPIRRWKMEVLTLDIRKSSIADGMVGADLDGKELEFLNGNRPASRFLYFHFIMALVRMKDLKRPGWETIWATYSEHRPFPTPGPYIRKSMLHALATHFEATDMQVVNSWIRDNGFDTSLQLAPEESTEVARRVHETVEKAVSRAERGDYEDNEIQNEDGEEGDEDEEEEG